jgi:hypothetical protein
MNIRTAASSATSLLILAIAACECTPNLGAVPLAPSSLNLAGTITAQALIIQASTDQAALAQRNTTRTPHPRITPTASVTPTPGAPLASVSSPTNCRTGPSTAYDLVTSLAVGQTAEVVGKDTHDNYWIIKTGGGSGRCWLWGQYATVTGNTGNLPEIKPPPTPMPTKPAAPTGFGGSISACKGGVSGTELDEFGHIDLHWNDVAENEDGYHIYRDGKRVATLDANSTSFSDDVSMYQELSLGPPHVTYAVEAFNKAGASKQQQASFQCP